MSIYCLPPLSALVTAAFLSFAAASPGAPLNDQFDSAIVLTGLPASATGTTDGATPEAGEPSHTQRGFRRPESVWYTWTAESSGTVQVTFASETLLPSGVNILAVYSGSSLETLEPVANGSLTVPGVVRNYTTLFDAVEGTLYAIAVARGVDSLSGVGEFQLEITPGPPVAMNAAFADAFDLGSGVTASFVSDARAGGGIREADEPIHTATAEDSWWFRWTPEQDGPVSVNLNGSTGFPKLAVYTGETPSSLLRIDLSNSTLFSAVAGATYWFAAYRDARTPVGPGLLAINLMQFNGALGNRFSDAITVPSTLPALVTTPGIGVLREAGETSPISILGATGSKWFSWIAAESGEVQMRSANSISVFTGESLDSLVETPRLPDVAQTFVVVQGERYTIRLTVAQIQRGQLFELSIARPRTAPVNDNFADAIPLPSTLPFTSDLEFSAATIEIGEPVHFSGRTGRDPTTSSIWYLWSPPSAGAYQITLMKTGSSILDIVGAQGVAVYRGAGIDELELIASGEVEKPFSLQTDAGETLYLAIAGISRVSTFPEPIEARITIDAATSAGMNDAFANATNLGSSAPVSAPGSTIQATTEAGEPDIFGSANFASVWYRWTAPTSARYEFATAPQDSQLSDSRLAIYAGSELSDLSEISAGLPYGLRFDAVAGEEYYLVVDAESGATSEFTVSVSSPVGYPENDSFDSPEILSGELPSSTIVSTPQAATFELSEPALPSGDSEPSGSLWFQWTAPSEARVVVNFDNQALDQISIFTGNDLAALTEVVEGESPLAFDIVSGENYRIRIETRTLLLVDTLLSIRVEGRTAPNDDFASAIDLGSSTSGAVAIEANQGTRETGEPVDNPTAQATFWWRWTAPRTGYFSAEIILENNFLSPNTSLYTGTELSALQSFGRVNGVPLLVIKDTAYYIQGSPFQDQISAGLLDYLFLPLTDYEQFVVNAGGDLTALQWAPQSDLDGDGISNLAEFFHGSPVASHSSFGDDLLQIQQTGPALAEITYPISPGILAPAIGSPRSIGIETGTDALNVFGNPAFPSASDEGIVTFPIEIAPEKQSRFYRLLYRDPNLRN